MNGHTSDVAGLISGGKLILDDVKRVAKIRDRGNSFRRRAQLSNGAPRRLNEPRQDKRLIELVAWQLDQAKVSFILEPGKKYVPYPSFAQILTLDRVHQIVYNLQCFSGTPNKDQLARDIYYGSQSGTRAPCVKMLAILIGIDKAEDMADYMLKDKMTDDCLPLQRVAGNDQQLLGCLTHGMHSKINEYFRPDYRERFCQWSYAVNAPYVAKKGSLHSHYILDTGDVFPMDVVEAVEEKDHTDTTAKASQPDENTYGGFSEVFKVKLHDGHHDFGEHGIRHPQGFFALKKLTSHSKLTFDLELSSLIITVQQYTRKKHLIQLLATFEVKNPATKDSTFYLLFDWAEGSLNKFWECNSALVGNKNHCLWMATQFYEISEALVCVHNDRAPTLRYLEDRNSNKELYGRHGDIKPSNFLWFNQANSLPGLLALSDFGLGRLHTQVSRSKQDPKNIERTATYRCPEFDLPFGQVSPRSDIFSLGCVLLEYVTWFFMGLEAVEKVFPEVRSERDIYGFDSDVFFSIRNEQAYLKPAVAKWIEELQNRRDCSWYIWHLLEIIKLRMLDPNGATRIPANQLAREMNKLRATCLSEPDYFLGVRSRT
ncbi:Cyclin-dependent kinase E-1 [Colletotrichum chlorophyti]|uniref:Cyclin-dependent kinase E-1 n=1 Tax=Colletotrichum chlorophyti TaxID=708187 RepID=A0A1Q8S4D2_9PEZI|nr:Cyclin-dependent kinase E-1 [Colletotrichum chlorophyti]